MKTLWNISELSAHTANALASLHVDQESNRVSDAPSSRTIRYYTTHGLLDRPAEFRGRTALYTERHLLQLVAIKVLQSKGRSLADIHGAVIGADDEALRHISGLEVSETEDVMAAPVKAERSFWREAPQERKPVSRRVEQPVQQQMPIDLTVLPAIQLADGVTLVLETTDLLDSDLQSIRAAAEPLVALLQKRRLVRPKP